MISKSDTFTCRCNGKIYWDEVMGWWECDSCDFAALDDDGELPEDPVEGEDQ